MSVENEEEWRDVAEYEDIYEVSSLGNVRNKKTKRVLRPATKGGYALVGLCKDGKGKTIPVHRLVAFAFIPNPENKPFVNHIDGNKTNNSLVNLEFATVQENCLHSAKTGLIKFYKRKVGQYTLDNVLIKKFNSIKEAMDETGITTIKGVLYKQFNTGGGFIWKYLE